MLQSRIEALAEKTLVSLQVRALENNNHLAPRPRLTLLKPPRRQ